MTSDQFRKITNCGDCPCLSVDFEQGEWCNLGYDVKYYWTKEAKIFTGCENCGLVIIRYKEKKVLKKYHIESSIGRRERTDGK